MRINLPVLLLCASVSCANAEKYCGNQQSHLAEAALDNIHNWDDFYQAYRKYRNCDDGSVAEGLSDKAVKLLIGAWPSVHRLAVLSRDATFQEFVLYHVNGLMSPADAATIADNARGHCPSSARVLCMELIKKSTNRE
jgi:hypothetical protein